MSCWTLCVYIGGPTFFIRCRSPCQPATDCGHPKGHALPYVRCSTSSPGSRSLYAIQVKELRLRLTRLREKNELVQRYWEEILTDQTLRYAGMKLSEKARTGRA